MRPRAGAGRRILWSMLPLILVAMIILMLMPAAALAATFEADGPDALREALREAQDGDTIQITRSFSHDSPIVVIGEDITLDVGANTLTIGFDGTAISVSGADAALRLDDSLGGRLKVLKSGPKNDETSVSAEGGAVVEVSSIEVSNGSRVTGAHAIEESAITVKGDVTMNGQSSRGVFAQGKGTVTVGGKVTITGSSAKGVESDSDGVITVNGNLAVDGYRGEGAVAIEGGDITVKGNISAKGQDAWGVWADLGGTVTVNGSVTTNGASSVGVFGNQATATVKSDVTATGTGAIGVEARSSSQVTVDGVLTAPIFISLEGVTKTAANKTATTTKSGYATFAQGTSTVWLKAYTLSFNSQGGSAVASQPVPKNAIAVKPVDPTRSGHVLTAWYKEPACVNIWDFNTAKVTNNTTLYAKWTKVKTFTDVNSGYAYYKAITELSTRGIISGYTDGTFRPANPVIRQQFAKMILGTLGITPKETDMCKFTDVQHLKTDLYPYHYVAKCAALGITNGTSATTFSPGKNMTRAQLITMVVRAAGSRLTKPAGATPFGKFDTTHYPNAQKAYANGLLNGLAGMGQGYNFYANATRGEVAQVLYNFLQLR